MSEFIGKKPIVISKISSNILTQKAFLLHGEFIYSIDYYDLLDMPIIDIW